MRLRPPTLAPIGREVIPFFAGRSLGSRSRSQTAPPSAIAVSTLAEFCPSPPKSDGIGVIGRPVRQRDSFSVKVFVVSIASKLCCKGDPVGAGFNPYQVAIKEPMEIGANKQAVLNVIGM